MEASSALSHYLLNCEFRGASPNTLKLYAFRLSPFVALHGYGDETTLIHYLKRWPNERTRFQVFRTIKTFIRWCSVLKRGWCADYTTDMRPRFALAPQREPITVADLDLILSSAPDTLVGHRNRALYMVLLYTGARRDAIRLLTWDRVNLESGSIRFTTKGRVEQDIPIAPQCAAALAAWRAECPAGALVFPSTRDLERPIDASYITHQLPLLALKARFPRPVNVHLLRHSHVTIMADAGVPYETIQLSTGHASTAMLRIYDRRNPARLRAALKTVFG